MGHADGIMSPAKRIVLLTYGTRGDLEPFLALAGGLLCEGYRVRLVGPGRYESLAAWRGVEYAGLVGDPQAVAVGLSQRAGLNGIRMFQFMASYLYPLAYSVFQQCIEAAGDAAAIVHSFLMTYVGHHLAADLGVPDISAQFFPVFWPTANYPAPVFPDWPLGPGYRRLTHRVVTQAFRRGSRALYWRLRRAHPDLPRLNEWSLDPSGRVRLPLLMAYSRHVLPAPEPAPDAQVTGYWFSDDAPGWEAPAEVQAFLDSGPAPVFIGFGSMTTTRQQQVLHACLQAIEMTGGRAVLSSEDLSESQEDLPRSVLSIGEVPHGWLFPRMAAIVHHGGAGTTGNALRAGVPSVVVPFTADQAFWGRRVSLLGVGPPPIRVGELRADRLAQALRQALTDPGMRARAADLGERIRVERGVEQAVAFVREIVGPP